MCFKGFRTVLCFVKLYKVKRSFVHLLNSFFSWTWRRRQQLSESVSPRSSVTSASSTCAFRGRMYFRFGKFHDILYVLRFYRTLCLSHLTSLNFIVVTNQMKPSCVVVLGNSPNKVRNNLAVMFCIPQPHILSMRGV